MSIQTIYARLVKAGMSPVGACSMMGNMQAESAMRANNAQDGLSSLSDAVYTDYANRGLIDFVNDSIGYGLCQWTYGPRKRNLLNFARGYGVSVGSEDMQVDFCIHELKTEYSGLWQYLTTATGVYEATGRICREYERPAINNIDVRAGFANDFYMTLGGMDVSGIEIQIGPDNSPTGEPEDAIFHTPVGGVIESNQSSPTINLNPNEFWPPRVLEYGMTGADVVALQGLLIAHNFPAGITGVFDNPTNNQLMAFQAAHNLKIDGIAGDKSWTALTKR